MQIRFDPKECDPNCPLPDCPYIHVDIWTVYSDDGRLLETFRSEQDAKDFVKANTKKA